MSKEKKEKAEKKNKKIKLTSSVEKNIVQICNTIVKIYHLKIEELAYKTIKIDNNTEENRQKIFDKQAELRDVLNDCHYDIKALYENEEYEGRRARSNYLEEFINKEPKVLRRYAYFDIERILREDYMYCKNKAVRKAIRGMLKQKRRFIRLSNSYTRETTMKKNIVNGNV